MFSYRPRSIIYCESEISSILIIVDTAITEIVFHTLGGALPQLDLAFLWRMDMILDDSRTKLDQATPPRLPRSQQNP